MSKRISMQEQARIVRKRQVLDAALRQAQRGASVEQITTTLRSLAVLENAAGHRHTAANILERMGEAYLKAGNVAKAMDAYKSAGLLYLKAVPRIAGNLSTKSKARTARKRILQNAISAFTIAQEPRLMQRAQRMAR
jgi:tetratricopeptide (TPR) repeat protein